MSADPETTAPAFVARALLESWGIRGSMRRLPGYADKNYLVDDGSRRFVFKLAATDDDLDFQVAILEHLEAKRAAGAALPRFPRLVPTTASESLIWVDDSRGRRRTARLIEYVEGETLADVRPRTSALLSGLGAMLAAVDNALADFDHPGGSRYEPWDIAHAPDALADIDAIEDIRTRRMVATRLEEFAQTWRDVAGSLPTGIIHNDANDHNVIVSKAGSEVVGLIDFGDSVRTATIFDLAIACAYAMIGADEPLEVAKLVVGGYESVRALTQPERDILLPAIRARLGRSLIMSAKSRRTNPDDAYLQVSDQGARALLATLESVDSDTSIPALRAQYLGKSLSLSYDAPLHIIRGEGNYLYANDERAYLDCVNNVCHVGHCHPRVVAAASRQMSKLNTNTRYLHDAIIRYAERLTSTLPEPLSVCYFVNSGSEANDLAIRLARAYTRATGIAVLDHAYHGNLSSLIDISPYKFNGPGGQGKPPHVAILPMPDPYRGVFGDDLSGIETLAQSAFGLSAFFAESLAGCAGQVEYPDGFLRAGYDMAHNAGAVCVADEVQVGFGRVGSHFWGFETQGVVPDIVTLGKPMGNGHPLGAVVTTKAISEAFANGMEYFNTYGGNPVSCVVGLEVLRVIEDEQLQQNALATGDYLLSGLRDLQTRFPLLGDVRGRGLFIGVELVDDADARTPAPQQAAFVVNRMKDEGVLLSTDGPNHNVIKIKPPLTFGKSEADVLISKLDVVLAQRLAQPAVRA